jgi:hypothetical protein
MLCTANADEWRGLNYASDLEPDAMSERQRERLWDLDREIVAFLLGKLQSGEWTASGVVPGVVGVVRPEADWWTRPVRVYPWSARVGLDDAQIHHVMIDVGNDSSSGARPPAGTRKGVSQSAVNAWMVDHARKHLAETGAKVHREPAAAACRKAKGATFRMASEAYRLLPDSLKHLPGRP